MNVLFNYSGTSASREPMSARAWFDESETALADRPSLAPLHVVHRETSFRVHGNIQEKWWAPRDSALPSLLAAPDSLPAPLQVPTDQRRPPPAVVH